MLEKQLLEEFRWFHQHPELSYEEIGTTKRLRTLLTQGGVRILELPLKTGLVAEIGPKDAAFTVALRADIDALPIEEETSLAYRSVCAGKMHACGHDFHMTAVLGAALLLKQQEDFLKGRVLILFQPAEEAPGGAKVLMDTGVLEDVNVIFGLHCSPRLDVGTVGITEGAVTASVDRFNITFRGKGTHAAHPDGGIDPIPMLSAFVQGVQTIVSRNLEPFSPGLVSVTHIEAGNTWNVIPETALAEGTTRSMTAADRRMIKERVYDFAYQIATAYGGQAEIDWYAGPPATNNTREWAELSAHVAKQEGLTVLKAPGSLAGEDFAFYQEKLPGAFLLVGTGKSAANHNPKFEIDPKAIYPAAKYLASLVLSAMGN